MRTFTPSFVLLGYVLALLSCSTPAKQEQPVATAKPYTIEQFMNTTRIAGSAFSPDETKVLFSSNQTGIFNAFEVPAAGGEAKGLTDSKTNSVYAISYFPADERILFSSDQGGNEISHLYVRNPDGNIKDLTPDSSAISQFAAWSFDKKSFFYTSNKRDPSAFDVYEMDLQTLHSKLVYKNEGGFFPGDISNDKRYISLSKPITTANSDIYLYDTQTKKTTLLTEHQGEVQFQPVTFSVDSKSLYFLTDEGSEFTYLKKYDLATATQEKVEEAAWDIQYSYFSRNGKYRVTAINKDAKTDIRIYNAADNQPVVLPAMPNGEITSVNISDSEKLMTFYVNSSKSPNNLYVYNFETKEYKQLSNTMNPEIAQADLVEAQVIRYKSFDGMEIPALLYTPNGA